jgi:hypothetical protein
MNSEKIDKTKIILIACILFLLGILIFLTCSVREIKQSLKESQEKLATNTIQMKDLEDSIKRSQSSYVTQGSLEKSLSELGMDKVKEDLDSLDAKLVAINKILTKTPGLYITNVPSTGSKPKPPSEPFIPPQLPCVSGTCPNPDVYGYLNNEKILSIDEPFENMAVPFGKTSFKAWQEKPWTLQIFPRGYHVSNVLSQNEDGQYIVHNKFEIEVEGKKYPVKISESTTTQEVNDSEFWFNPKLYLGIGAGVTVTPELRAEVVPSLNVSMFSYGPNKKESTFSMLGVGISAHTQNLAPAISISPVNYNVGEVLPLIDNLFIGPTVAIDTNANVSISGSVQVGL